MPDARPTICITSGGHLPAERFPVTQPPRLPRVYVCVRWQHIKRSSAHRAPHHLRKMHMKKREWRRCQVFIRESLSGIKAVRFRTFMARVTYTKRTRSVT